MKFIVERWGIIISSRDIWQRVEIDADSLEDAKDLAWEGEGSDKLRVVAGHGLWEWDSCDSGRISDVVEAEDFCLRKQLRFAARFAPVFDDYSGK